MSRTKKIEWGTVVFFPIVTGVLSTLLADYVKEKPILSTLFSILKSIGNFILSFLNFELKLWWVMVALVVLVVANAIYESIQAEKEPKKKPGYIRYQQDRFKNWLWKWDWKWNGSTKLWEIINLYPFCPKCDIELLYQSSWNRRGAKCPKCLKFYDEYEVDDAQAVGTVILDNVKKNLYRERI